MFWRVPRYVFALSGLLLSCSTLHAYDNIQLKLTLTAPSTSQTFSPTGVVVDRTGKIWVTDPPSNSIVVFSSAGEFVQQIGHAGTGLGEFSGPHGIATDLEGTIYIADTGNNRVQVLSPDGKPRLAFGERGDGSGQMRNPEGLAVSQDGVVVIADSGNEIHAICVDPGVVLNHTFRRQYPAGDWRE